MIETREDRWSTGARAGGGWYGVVGHACGNMRTCGGLVVRCVRGRRRARRVVKKMRVKEKVEGREVPEGNGRRVPEGNGRKVPEGNGRKVPEGNGRSVPEGNGKKLEDEVPEGRIMPEGGGKVPESRMPGGRGVPEGRDVLGGRRVRVFV